MFRNPKGEWILMEHFEQLLKEFQKRYNVSEECLDEVRKLCVSHAINCSMDVVLLEQSSAWLVDKIVKAIEQEEAWLAKQTNSL